MRPSSRGGFVVHSSASVGVGFPPTLADINTFYIVADWALLCSAVTAPGRGCVLLPPPSFALVSDEVFLQRRCTIMPVADWVVPIA